MDVKFEHGIYEIDNGALLLKVSKDHQILNIDDLNRYFHIKVPPTSVLTVERLLQHEEVKRYKELNDYLLAVVRELNNDREVIIIEEEKPISRLVRRELNLDDIIPSLVAIKKCLIILLLVWIVIMILEVSRLAKIEPTTLDLSHKRYYRN